MLTIFFICPFFFLTNQIFCYRFLGFYESQSSNFLNTLRVAKYIVGKKTKMLKFIFTIYFHFSLSHSNVIHREICVKDFSGTTTPRILKFGTSVGYDLYCCCLSFPLFVHFSFSPIKLFFTEFCAPITASVFKFCIHLERGQVYCVKENQDSVINFCLLFQFFLFSISHSNVIHREICVKDFTGTTVPRILKFGTNVGYDLLYYVKENQYAAACHCLICRFFFSPSKFSVTNFSASMGARVFKFCIHMESGQVYCGTENKTQIYFALFLIFSIAHSNVIHREICDKYFSGTIAGRIS